MRSIVGKTTSGQYKEDCKNSHYTTLLVIDGVIPKLAKCRSISTLRGGYDKVRHREYLNPWQLLRYGDPKQGLAFLLDVWKRNATPSHTMELGIAYFWTGDFEAASRHFDETIRKFPGSMSSFYGMAGAAKWCLGEFSAAVGTWKAGLNVRYADAAGLGVRIPLLLFIVSVPEPELFQRKKAEEILLRKIEDVRANSWPGSLVGFVLGQESEEKARSVASPATLVFDQKHREWLIEFYRKPWSFGAVI